MNKATNNHKTTDNDPFLKTSQQKSIEAEQGLIAACLINPRVIDEVVNIVKPDMFFSDNFSIIFNAIRMIHSNGLNLDLAILIDHLKKTGKLEPIGGGPFIASILTCDYISITNAVHYATIIRDHDMSRNLLEALSEGINRLYDGEHYRDVQSFVEQRILENHGMITNEPATMHDCLLDVLMQLDEDHPQQSLVPSGFDKLDEMIGCFRPGQLIIIAARPSMGKTAFATNIAQNVAKSDIPTLFVSLEMSRTEITQRMIASTCDMSLSEVMCPFTNQQKQKIAEAAQTIVNQKLFIHDNAENTVIDIMSATRLAMSKHDVKLLIIDYLGLITPENQKQTRYEQTTLISRRLKQMARMLKIPVIVLAQLNREPGQSKDNKPKIHHLRDSGAIEQDADVVLLLHRENYYDRDANPRHAEAIAAKVRNGKTGTTSLDWNCETTTFKECDEWEDWQPTTKQTTKPKRFSKDRFTDKDEVQGYSEWHP